MKRSAGSASQFKFGGGGISNLIAQVKIEMQCDLYDQVSLLLVGLIDLEMIASRVL